MDFLTTARMLMDLRERYPQLRYRFSDGILTLEAWVEHDVPDLFDQASQMFSAY